MNDLTKNAVRARATQQPSSDYPGIEDEIRAAMNRIMPLNL
jgi:hypothetical protein